MPLLAVEHTDFTDFLGTRAAFSSCSCTTSNIVRSSSAQDHSHQNSLVNNLIEFYKTFSLKTEECLKLERRGFAIIHSTGNLWIYASFELIAYEEERPFSENGEWALFPTADRKSWFKSFHKACREPPISLEVISCCSCQNEVAFLFPVIIFCTSKSPGTVCRHIPEGILNILLTGKY